MSHFVMKQGDNFPKLQVSLEQENLSPVDLQDGTVELVMVSIHGRRIIGGPARLLDAEHAVIEYAWHPGDTAYTGTYKAHFLITTNGRQLTIPSEDHLLISIIE